VAVAAANASPRGQRHAVLASPAADFIGWRLAIDCGGRACGGERAYAVAALMALHGQPPTMSRMVQRLKCHICRRAPMTVYLETGPELTARGRLRRVALLGPDDPTQNRNW
jgi:hypothetical protein